MEIMGTNFSITLGSWRLRLGFAIEDVDTQAQAKEPPPHRVRIVPEDMPYYSRREAVRAYLPHWSVIVPIAPTEMCSDPSQRYV